MKAWSRVAPEHYRALPLEAHALLADVPLHDVWEVTLPGGGEGRSVADLRHLMQVEGMDDANPVVAFLFRLRRLLGHLFGWDRDDETARATGSSYQDRVPEALRLRSDPPPGTSDGPFALLYALPGEAVSEVRNATVHAFSVVSLRPEPGGYRATWAIHVAPVGRITGFYMALIDPFRRFVVYPAVLGSVHRRWREAYGGDA